jgi:SPP1 family predicted phage head-tail adaptor
MNTLGPRLKQRITLQDQTNEKDSDGNDSTVWTPWLVDEPAEVLYLSGREFIAAQSAQSQITGRATIRWRPGVTASMRFLFDGGIFNIVSVLPDSSSRRWLTLMFEAGVDSGRR